MNHKEKAELKEMIEKLYTINAYISAHFITKITKIDYAGICNINELLGEMIKQFREFTEK